MTTARRSFLKHASLASFSLWIPKTFAEASTARLARSTPEAQGVSAKAILDFIEAVEREKMELHSFMMLRRAKSSRRAGGSHTGRISFTRCTR
jgi:hypothetical protein